jgi:RNA polymerase sigma factor for flagellar operon FliA
MLNRAAAIEVESDTSRDELILSSMALVYSIARRLISTLPPETSMDDLVSAGTIGLIHAVNNFDPKLDIKLSTYAAHRIRGAMLDSLRAADWVPRRQRTRLKRLQLAVDQAQSESMETNLPDDRIAESLGTSVEEYREMLAAVSVTRVVSIEGMSEDGSSAADYLTDEGAEPVWEAIERDQLRELLRKGIERLDDEERAVLSFYYDEEMAPQEIAQIMGLPAKRVYQLKSQAILRLRSAVGRRLMKRASSYVTSIES